MFAEVIPKYGVAKVNSRKQESHAGIGLKSEKVTDQRKTNYQKQAESQKWPGKFILFKINFQNLINKYAGIRNDNKEEPFFDGHSFKVNTNSIFRIKTPDFCFSKTDVPPPKDGSGNYDSRKNVFQVFIILNFLVEAQN